MLQFKISEPVSIPQYQIQNTKVVELKTSDLIPECKIKKELEFEEINIKEEFNYDDLTNERIKVESSNSTNTVELSVNEIGTLNFNKCNKCNLVNCECNKSKKEKKTHKCSICNEHFLTVKYMLLFLLFSTLMFGYVLLSKSKNYIF